MVIAGYKKTELGMIPEDWDTPKLAHILTAMQLGGNYKNGDRETSWPLIKMGNLGRGQIKLDKLEYINSTQPPSTKDRLKKNDVLFNTRNTLDLVGKVALWCEELPQAYFNSNIMRMGFDEAKVSSKRFMSYVLNTPQVIKDLRGIAIGTTSVAAIYGRDLKQIKIVLPTKGEQRAIAAALSDVDELIAGLDALIAKKHAIKQATMQQLLTGKTRLPGFDRCGGRFKKSEVGMIPEDWASIPIGEISSVSSGGTPSRNIDQYWGGAIPWVTTTEIDFNRICSTQQYITREGLRNSAAKFCHEGTLLVAMYGQGKTRGKVAILEIPATTNQACAAIELKANFSPNFIFHFLASKYDDLRNSSNSGGQENLSGQLIKKFQVVVPRLSEQTAIAEVLTEMDEEVAALEARRDKTRAVKQGMVQELLTGRIRLVPDVEQ